ncbi:MAG: hypothetical protein GY754_08605 [bacterium]|nr:hypothetical protein [bacterium]
MSEITQQKKNSTSYDIFFFILTTAVYFITARLSLRLAVGSSNATVVWPPSGIALGIIILKGYRLSPAIFIGAFAANILSLKSSGLAPVFFVSASFTTAIGNTLEAVLGTYLIKRFSKRDRPFNKIKNLFMFIFLGSLVSTMASATIGVSSYCILGDDWSLFYRLWFTWWLGDATGILIVSPLIVLFNKEAFIRIKANKIFEGTVIFIVLIVLSIVIFNNKLKLEYLLVPLLLWLAIRFDRFYSALAVFLVSSIAIIFITDLFNTSTDITAYSSLLYLQSFVGVMSVVTLCISVTMFSRRKAKKEIHHYKEHLEEIVELRSSELIKANNRLSSQLEKQKKVETALAREKEKAEAADRLKSAFLATMSHELRTPLNSIIGLSGILDQELSGPLNKEQKKQIGIVRKSSKHLLSLINDVLDISKIEAGQLEIDLDLFNLKELIEKVIEAIKPSADKEGLSVSVKIRNSIGNITSDQRRVEQVLLNLLSNAVKFTDEGEITLNISIVENKKTAVQFKVIDTGIGILEKDIKELFLPFHQVDNGISRRTEGTGLGLAICDKLAKLLGGHIEVESKIGEGSTFIFTLPLKEM